MLRTLHIRDFVIVEQTEIHFGPGFTVFSGETGAGKSILIDALALALGERGDVSVLREGAARADITAVFDTPPALRAWLAEREIDADDELALRRVIDAQGRSRAYINGTPATVAQLRELGDSLVDIHGQHAHQSLMRPEAQRDLLDAHGGHGELRQGVAQAWKQWRALARQLELAEKDAAGLAAERERLQWQVDELDRLGLAPDEWDALQSEHTRLSHSQSLLDGATQILDALDGEGDSAHHRLTAANQRIQQMLRHDTGLQGIYDELESARIAISEAVSDLNNYVSRVDLDPRRLADVEARLSAVFETARKFRTEPEALCALRDSLHAELSALQAAADIDALRAQTQAAQAQYDAAAAKLTTARRKVAKDLGKQVTQAMQTLAMQGGKFEPTLAAAAPSAHGNEHVEFLVAGHAGTTPRPLAKVASGGELSRISLALSVIASRAARVPTLIFDEVDSGVGGAVAEAVGKLLRELGERHQVLCVTHLPQVAACGNNQFLVSKTESRGTTRSRIEELDDGARVEEIARMLGGIKLTATTREHAREMLAGFGRAPA
ncbi:DNA repair protein RecN [Achromobacter xylosoxidans]|jgi:DNA repair protein RecN (Recombination protein N)|uniref:DNA repair protein RecN n=1 Tax=Alcaligenes xylosoxydans xylosoxydans TaxID=85698 RepID=UPI0008A5C2C4|nr:DNA repair protein RecN [Achromobacter xylosoxidans]MDZ5615237.1 DNA repair protein RecN [Achromobacter xylosoxidans]MDZ5623959.1 DNA repair protein RecN [Achromobacter xylosoxidans]MDZ5683657.1 DNA repair protein RecN [Achromobacter xylosoxidans]OFQ48762.1 DNA repair protein RecN [Achromobacter xylosoxidans]OMG89893.1 DNA repair protein RecN [Achromobacter xylosoxidans]